MYRFDDHLFDPGTGDLSSPAGVRRLQPKPARLLAMLLEADGQLVERDRIRNSLWPATHVDFDSGLNTCIRQIRSALGDGDGDPEWVETLPKRGYRFTARVRREQRHGLSVVPAEATPPTKLGAAPLQPAVLAVVLLAMVGAAAVGWRMAGSSGGGSAPTLGAVEAARLAIVPFEDPDSDESAAFNRSLTESFIEGLTAVSPAELVVIGPTTTAPLVAQGLSMTEVAVAVDADFVLHGGHRRAAGVIFVEVVLAPGGEHLFAQRMDLDINSPATAPPDVVAAMASSIIDANRQ